VEGLWAWSLEATRRGRSVGGSVESWRYWRGHWTGGAPESHCLRLSEYGLIVIGDLGVCEEEWGFGGLRLCVMRRNGDLPIWGSAGLPDSVVCQSASVDSVRPAKCEEEKGFKGKKGIGID
jgi:hypothetical protein